MNRFFSMAAAAVLPLTMLACAEPSASGDGAGTSTANLDQKNNASNGLSYGETVATQTIMRSVLEKKLLLTEGTTSNDADYLKMKYEILTAALEGPGKGPVVATVYSFECERGLGSDYCTMGIGTDTTAPNPNGDETEAGYELRVRIYQGTVSSAELVLTAG